MNEQEGEATIQEAKRGKSGPDANNFEELARVRCKACLEPIPAGARVCGHCQRHQSWTVRHLPNIGVLVSLGLLVIAALQLYMAAQERQDAKEAAEVANKAAAVASTARIEAKGAVNELKVLRADVQQDLIRASELARSALSDAEMVSQDLVLTKRDLQTQRINDISVQLQDLKQQLGNANIELMRVRPISVDMTANEARKHIQERSLLLKEINRIQSKMSELNAELESLQR